MLKIPFFFGLRSCPALPYLSHVWYRGAKFVAVCLALLIILASSTTLPASVTGLVGYWPFDEGAGTTVTDFSGNENTGTLVNGPTYGVGKFSYGLSLDGVDQYVEIAHSDSLNLTNELTVSAWIYNQAAGNSLLLDPEYHIIVSKGWAVGPGGSWTLAWDKKTNNLSFLVRKHSDKGYNYVLFNYGSLTNDWHHITAVFNNGKISLYIDGSLAAGPVALGANSIKSNTADVRLGAVLQNPSNLLQNWDGYIDEVQIYNQALTDAEIKALYDGTESQRPADSSVSKTSTSPLTTGSSALTSSAGSSGSTDFSLSSVASISVAQGASVTTTISANSTTGKRFSVSFLVTGLPQGVSASFSPQACNLNCSTLLTFQASVSTQGGTYPITVKGYSGSKVSTTSFTLSVTTPTVATPTISPNGSTFINSVNVTLADNTSGSSIYYTIDGTDPTQTSNMYTAPFTLAKTALVKAKAFKSGATPSSVASTWFTQEASFDFALSNSGNKSVTAGSSVTNSISATLVSGATQAVSFNVSGLPSGATGSFSSTSCSPTCSSTLTFITSGSTPGGTSTVTVTATGGGAIRTTFFNLTVNLPTAATPTITPNGGSYTGSVSVTLQTATSGASIYYTTDGSTPTQSSSLYTGAMTLTSSAVLNAKAFMSGYNPSGVASASFTVTQPFDFSLSNSGNQSVLAGSSVTNSISATLVSGSTQPVSFSVSGLPTGAMAAFSLTSCSPTCSSTLTIGTSGSTPAGSSTITVTATGGGVTRTTSFGLIVSLPTLTVNWQDNSTNEDNFQVERKTGTSGTYSQIALAPANSTSYLDTNLSHGVTYCYRVRAANSSGTSDYSNEACATVP